MPKDLREVNAREKIDDVLLLIPIGSIEQHCSLPVGTDCLIAERLSWMLCRTFEEKYDKKCIIAPPLCYAFSPEWSTTPGTISLSLRTFSDLIKEIIKSLARWGFREIILLNGHAGNSSPLTSILSEITNLFEKRIKTALIDYWRCLDIDIGHANTVESRILEYLGFKTKHMGDIKCLEAKTSNFRGLKIFTKGSGSLEKITSEKKEDINLTKIINCLVNALLYFENKITVSEHYLG